MPLLFCTFTILLFSAYHIFGNHGTEPELRRELTERCSSDSVLRYKKEQIRFSSVIPPMEPKTRRSKIVNTP